METVEYASAVPIALSSIGTVFFTALATVTGTARSGPTAEVFELHETHDRDAARIRTSDANVPAFVDDDFFMALFLTAPLPTLSTIPYSGRDFEFNFWNSLACNT
jgi:hypothetical protein